MPQERALSGQMNQIGNFIKEGDEADEEDDFIAKEIVSKGGTISKWTKKLATKLGITFYKEWDPAHIFPKSYHNKRNGFMYKHNID